MVYYLNFYLNYYSERYQICAIGSIVGVFPIWADT